MAIDTTVAALVETNAVNNQQTQQSLVNQMMAAMQPVVVAVSSKAAQMILETDAVEALDDVAAGQVAAKVAQTTRPETGAE